MSKAIVTKDNFIWMDVTDKMRHGNKAREAFWHYNELYAIHDDDSESLLESHEEIDEAIKLGLRIGIEVGYMPRKQKRKWFYSAEKELIDGYWYVKVADIDFNN